MTAAGGERPAPGPLDTDGIKWIRVSYPDLHGICRGKEVPIEFFDAETGIAQTEAIMTIDLRHNILSGFEHGFRDFFARPDLSTLVRMPDDPSTAWCLADGFDLDGGRFALDPRGALRTQIEALADDDLHPIVAGELEFYLLNPADRSPYVSRDSSVYTCGPNADPRGTLRAIVDVVHGLGLQPIAATQEYGRGQYEINLRHGPALDAADRAFRFKAVVKDVALEHGLLATFLGQLHDNDEGSGFHLHLSLVRGDGSSAFFDAADPDGLSGIARSFIAGVLAHLPALTALLNPTVNAYRRFRADSLAPTHVNWGLGTRLTSIRVPVERGGGTRLEVRTGDGTANPHLVIAGVLAAGRDGLRRGLAPPEPMPDNPYDLASEAQGARLPDTLDGALDAFSADETLRAALGPALCRTFEDIKRAELARWHAELSRVTAWELDEYTRHL